MGRDAVVRVQLRGDDREKAEHGGINVNAAEFAQIVQSVSNEIFEPFSKVCVDLRRVNVGLT